MQHSPASEPSTTPQRTSSNESARSTTHRALYAAERAKLLFGGYRRGDANDADVYVASVAAVLACYDDEIIREATDPRTGISTDERYMSFMPNSGEVKVYCDVIRERRYRAKRYEQIHYQPLRRNLLPPPPPRQGDLANVFIQDTAPQYAAMCERATTENFREWNYDERGRPGLWVAASWLDQRPRSRWKAPDGGPTVAAAEAALREAAE